MTLLTVKLQDGDLQSAEELYIRFRRTRDSMQSLTQVARPAFLTQKDGRLSGSLVDIDVSCSTDLQSSHQWIINNAEQMNRFEKEAFSRMLKPEYIETLNPRYE